MQSLEEAGFNIGEAGTEPLKMKAPGSPACSRDAAKREWSVDSSDFA